MRFQVLAENAADCDRMADQVREALNRLDLEFPVLAETSPGRLAALSAPPPVLLEDGRILSSGKLLSAEEIAALIRSLHAGEMEKLARLSRRAKSRTRLTGRLLLLGAVVCAVLAVASGLRDRRETAAREAERPVTLHFSSPLKIYYFYRNGYSGSDRDQVTRLRHAAFEAFPEEALRNLVLILPLDAARAENAQLVRDCGAGTAPVIVLQKNGTCRKLEVRENGKPLAAQIFQAANEMQ